MTNLVEAINLDFKNCLDEINISSSPAKTLLQDANAQFIKRGCYLYGKKLFPIFLKPLFVNGSKIQKLKTATNSLLTAVEKFTTLYFTEPELQDLFQLKETEKRLLKIDAGLSKKIWITRNDAFLTDDDLKFIEFNSDSPGGPMYSDIQAEIIDNTPVMQEIRKNWKIHYDRLITRVLETLLIAYHEYCAYKKLRIKPKPYIAVVAGKKSSTLPEFNLICEWLKSQGYPACVQDPRDLDCDKSGFCTTEDGHTVDIIYRRGWLPDWTNHMDEIKPLLKSYSQGKVCVVNPPHSILGSNKHILGLLQEDRFQFLFDHQEKEAIREHLPWTRLMEQKNSKDWQGQEIDLYQFVRKNRDCLVLKPMDLSGGKDVCVGIASDQSTWESTIEKSTRHPFVVQRYVAIPEEEFPEVEPELIWNRKKINTNFFAYNHQYAGGFARTSTHHVINISKDGGLAALFFVFSRV